MTDQGQAKKSDSLVQQKQPVINSFVTYFNKKKAHLVGVIPKHLTPERVVKIAVAALMKTPKLMECDPTTIWLSVANAATLGLEINLLGSSWLIPFYNGKLGRMDCQLIIGYQGLIDLCRRSGHIKTIEARLVYKDDEFSFTFGLEPTLIHTPDLDSDNRFDGDIKAGYMVAELTDGAKVFEVMSIKEIIAIRGRSKSPNKGPWVTDFAEMCRKTLVRRGTKYLPKSIEMRQAMALEDTAYNDQLKLVGTDIDESIIQDIDLQDGKTSGSEALKKDLAKKRPTDRDKAQSIFIDTVHDSGVPMSLIYQALNADQDEVSGFTEDQYQEATKKVLDMKDEASNAEAQETETQTQT